MNSWISKFQTIKDGLRDLQLLQLLTKEKNSKPTSAIP